MIIAGEVIADSADTALVSSLAQKRSDYNGFNVAIISVPQIDSDPDTADTPEAIRDLIKGIYDAQTAMHMADSLLGYVLLLGDAFNPEREVLIPGYYGFPFGGGQGSRKSSDAYYASMDADPLVDLFPDVLVGRLPVDSDSANWELTNAINTTLDFEPISVGASWTDKILMLSGGNADNFTFLSEGAQGFVNFFDSVHAYYIPSTKTVTKKHAVLAPSDFALSQDFVEEVRDDQGIVALFDHGNYFYLRGINPGGCTLPVHYDTLGADVSPLVYLGGSQLGHFDYTADKAADPGDPCCTSPGSPCLDAPPTPIDSCDVMAERLVVQPNGAIGVIGYCRSQDAPDAQGDFANFFRALHEDNATTLGGVLLAIKLRSIDDFETKWNLTLFGDPAVNIAWRDLVHDSVDVAIGSLDINPTGIGGYMSSVSDNSIAFTIKNEFRNSVSDLSMEVWNGHPDSASSTLMVSHVVATIPAFGTVTETLNVGVGTAPITDVFVLLDPDTLRNEPTRANNLASRSFCTSPYKPGFPVRLSATPHHSIKSATLSATVGRELVVATSDGLECFSGSGGHLWSFTRPGPWTKTGPLIAHVDRDGIPYVVYEFGSYAYVLDGSGSVRDSILVGDTASSYAEQSTSIHQLSPDQDLEFITYKGNAVYAYELDGSLLWSHPIGLFGPTWGRSISVGDIVRGASNEVAFASEDSIKVVNAATGDLIWARDVGEASFQVLGNRSLTVLDRDKDGEMEVLVAGNRGTPVENHLILFGSNGAELWDRWIGGGSVIKAYQSVGDLDGDGIAEIVAASGRVCSL